MPTIRFTVPLTPDYSGAYQQVVTLNAKSIELSIDIMDGAHSYISDFHPIGALRFASSSQLEAAVRFSYIYHAADGVLELFGDDHVAPGQSTSLLTRMAGTGAVATHYTFPGPPPAAPLAPHVTHFDYAPGIEAVLAAAARTANAHLHAAAVASGQFRAVRVNTPPPPLETIEEKNKWTDMVGPQGEALGSFDPNATYPEGTVMVNRLYSVWGGTVTFSQNENIANVIGSSGDPEIGGKPWIEIWERQYGMEDSCTSHNWASGKKFVCNDAQQSNRVGGHVILGTVAKSMPKGSNQVYIIPICKNHNNNDNVYMRANVYTQGIWLNNYLGK